MFRAIVVCFAFMLTLVATGCDKSGDSKEASDDVAAQEGLKSIADGALSYFQEEHVDDTGLQVTTAVYPLAVEKVCAKKPTAGVWQDLRFSTKVENVEYCYQSSADRKKFAAGAKAGETTYCVKGDTSQPDGYPQLSKIEKGACDL